MRFIKIIIIALLFVVALVLIIQNQEVFTHKFELKLDLMVYKVGPYLTSNLVLTVAAFLIGVFFAVIWGAFSSVTLRSKLRERERRIKELERDKKESILSPSPFGSPSAETEKTE
jgi:putative membrane protein